MGESDRLLETFLSLRGSLARLVRGIVPPKEVEDIVQETYVRVCQVEHRDAIREPRSFLFRTAQNLALDHVKRSESRLTAGADSMDDLPAPELGPHSDATYAQVASDEEFVLFCEAVRDLPKQCRRAFVLKKVYGYTLKEIADEMGVGLPTVESHVVAGTKRCVRYLRERESQRSEGVRATTRGGALRGGRRA
jgi:RNA polymerase sigma-70 factor (ECF subfamily)